MGKQAAYTTEVWALLFLSRRDSQRIRRFFVREIGVNPQCVQRNLHLTVYHAARRLPGLKPFSERTRVVLAASETRFMVMAPGGENPRPNLEPARRKVGIRVHRQSEAMRGIEELRARLLQYETSDVLGKRKTSTHRRSAFGARNFQPHVTLLRPGSGIDRDLTKIGTRFREEFEAFTFNRFLVQISRRARRQ